MYLYFKYFIVILQEIIKKMEDYFAFDNSFYYFSIFSLKSIKIKRIFN
jgi:hypothetical protein